VRCKKHQTYISLHQSKKSRVAENSSSTGHCINFRATSILDITSEYTDCLVKEATEIHLNKNNVNRDCGFIMSQAWSPITNRLMTVKAEQVSESAHQPSCLTTSYNLQVYHNAGGL